MEQGKTKNLPDSVKNLAVLAPDLLDEGGHQYTYLLCLQEVASEMGADFTAYVSNSFNIQNARLKWVPLYPILRTHCFLPQFLMRFFRFFFGTSKLFLSKTFSLVYCESFSVAELGALALASACTYPKGNLLLQFRFDLPRKGIKKYAQRFFLKLLQQIWKTRLHLGVDSHLLQRDLKYLCSLESTVMPITLRSERDRHSWVRAKNFKKLTLGWFGAPRVEKGLYVIQSLISSEHDAYTTCVLHLSKSTPLPREEGKLKLCLYTYPLSRPYFCKKMQRIDLILLPYLPEKYGRRPSGIFVESLSHGKIPLVSDHTWMADELRNFDLDELIVDWFSPDLPSYFHKIYNLSSVSRKLHKMQQYYLSFHSQKTLTERFQQFFET